MNRKNLFYFLHNYLKAITCGKNAIIELIIVSKWIKYWKDTDLYHIEVSIDINVADTVRSYPTSILWFQLMENYLHSKLYHLFAYICDFQSKWTCMYNREGSCFECHTSQIDTEFCVKQSSSISKDTARFHLTVCVYNI